ncbi:MAG TPA: hypothetical protein VFH51_04215, partial [Myxococcota bacterium]|nr:hypothetical protein [Myxococcota bacterium]
NAKLDLRQELGRAAQAFPLESLQEHLFSYFPESLTKQFSDDIRHHPLAINIARTILTNWIIGDAGASWLPETSTMTGRSTADILYAYFAASALLEARTLKQQVDLVEARIDAATEYKLRLRIEDALEEVCTWLLRRQEPTSDGFYRAFPVALATLPGLMNLQDDLQTALTRVNAPKEMQSTVAILPRIDEVLDVALLASQSGQPVPRASEAIYLVGEKCGILPLIRHALESSSLEDLDRPSRFALRGQLRKQLLHLASGLMRAEENLKSVSEGTHAWMDALQKEVAPLDAGERPLCNLVMASERIARRAYALFGEPPRL